MNKTRLVCLLVLTLIVLWNNGCAGVVGAPTSADAGIVSAPSSLNFGSVTVNAASSPSTVTLTNAGHQSLSIVQASSSLSEFVLTGPSLPVTLASGQSVAFQVIFRPDAAKTFSGNLSFSLNPTSAGMKTIPFTGTGTSTAAVSPQITVSPTTASFAVNVGSSQSQATTVTNTGTATLNITQATMNGSGFGVSGLTLPLSLAPGQSSAFKVNFAPAAAGSVTGSLSLVSNSPNSPTQIALAGTGNSSQTAGLLVTPSAATFGNVTVGTTNTQTIKLTNSGAANLSISQATVSAKSFVVNGLALPLTLTPGQSTTFNVAFSPASAGAVTGSVSLVSNAPNSPSTIAISGTGVAGALQLSASTTTLSFGNVNLGSSKTQTVTLTNTGNSSVSISNITTSGTGFSVTGVTVPVTIAASSTTTFNTVFSPTAAGAVSGSISVVSNATNSPTTISLTGSGLQQVPAAGPLAAFPGAEGGGAGSVGGRGGTVMEVTNLNDSGAGSFRACAEASGPRTCVFRVGGTIQVLGQISISSPYLTVAGQTAPGGGILFSGTQMPAGSMFFITTHDVTIRYIRIRVGVGPGHSGGPSNGVAGIAMMNAPVYNVVIDHVSESWWDNKPFIIYTNYPAGTIHNVTIQWTMNNEGLAPDASRPGSQSVCGGSGAFSSALINSAFTDIDYHHNLFSDCSHRNLETAQVTMHEVNDIHYNWSFFATQYGGSQSSDVIGNKYKAGPATGAPYMCNGNPCEILILPYNGATTASTPSVYLFGNVGPNQPNPLGNQWQMAQQETCYQCGPAGPVPSSWQRSTPLPAEQIPIVADDVNNLENVLLPTVGASQRLDCNGNWVSNRDAVDIRLINQYNSGTGAIISSETQVGGFPTIAPGTACVDSDHDGIPDAWEIAHGLNPNDPTDAQKTAPNGYTYLENYLNGTNPTLTARTNSTTSTLAASLSPTLMLRGSNIGFLGTTQEREISLLPFTELLRHKSQGEALAIARFASSSLDRR